MSTSHPHVFTDLPASIPLSDQTKLIMLNAQVINGPPWMSLDETRLCEVCERALTGREVLVCESVFSGPPGFDLICPTRKCAGGPENWITMDGVDMELFGLRSVGDREEGDFGITLRIMPQYRDRKQRNALRRVLWDRPWKDGGSRARPNPAFARSLLGTCRRIALRSITGEFDPDFERARAMGFYPVARLEAIDNHLRSQREEVFFLSVELVCSVQLLADYEATGEQAVPVKMSPVQRLRTTFTAPQAKQAMNLGIRCALLANVLGDPSVDAEGFGWSSAANPPILPEDDNAAIAAKLLSPEEL